MIRVLTMIAVAGFVLSVASLSAAFAIAGPEAMTRGGWNFASSYWNHDGSRDWDWDDHDVSRSGVAGPQATRTLAWSGSDRLDIDLPADVRYVQVAGPATVTITGPKRAVDRVVIRGPSIRYDHRRGYWGPHLSIVVQAPNIRAFDLSGRNTLAIEGYRQETLALDVSGSADVTATGEAGEIELDLSGSGDVDFGGLKTRGADVEISGAADATIAPSEWARLDISGMGDVRLLTNPARLETDISGAGKVRQESAGPTTSAPPSPPTLPAAPKT